MNSPINPQTPHTYCGFAAVIGATNAGKSTLINQLVGHKVSIVSRKVQTTRSRILGIIQKPRHQVVLVDTPGIFQPKSRLERAMVDTAWNSINDSGLALHVVDVMVGNGAAQRKITDFLLQHKTPAMLVLNKIDLIEKPRLLQLIAEFSATEAYQQTLLLSALRQTGVDDLEKTLLHAMPKGPFLFDEDQVSDLPMRLLACEVVREHLFDRLHQEIPYGLTVIPELWQEMPDGAVRLSLCIQVQKQGHKPIVIGKGGKTLQTIGSRARHEIARLLEVPAVHLTLFVKVNPRWQDDMSQYQMWGLNYKA